MLIKRPISPHLSIYKLQLTSGLSILHRFTGAYLYLGLVLFSWLLFVSVYFPHIIVDYIQCTQNSLIFKIITNIMLFAWAFALFYHLLNGVRHLFWDIGKGLDLKSAYFSGKFVISVASILTILCWILATSYQSQPQENIEHKDIVGVLDDEQS